MIALPRVALRDVSRLEFVKWAAFVGMLLDHVDLAVFGRGQPWMHAIGGFCLPAFALCFGLGLARSADPMRVVERLVLPSVVAQAAWLVIQPEHPANVLVMFALCALIAVQAATSRWGLTVAAAIAVLAVSMGGEGGPPLVLLVAGGYLASRLDRDWPVMLAGAVWWALVPSLGALLAVLAVLYWPPGAARLARRPGWLAWGYAGHLVALAGLVAAGAWVSG